MALEMQGRADRTKGGRTGTNGGTNLPYEGTRDPERCALHAYSRVVFPPQNYHRPLPGAEFTVCLSMPAKQQQQQQQKQASSGWSATRRLGHTPANRRHERLFFQIAYAAIYGARLIAPTLNIKIAVSEDMTLLGSV